MSAEATIQRHTLISISGDSDVISRTRPSNAREVFILDWEEAGVVIPWPDGLTVKQAILAWAKAETP